MADFIKISVQRFTASFGSNVSEKGNSRTMRNDDEMAFDGAKKEHIAVILSPRTWLWHSIKDTFLQTLPTFLSHRMLADVQSPCHGLFTIHDAQPGQPVSAFHCSYIAILAERVQALKY